MRHGIAGRKLGRNQTLRKATMRDLAKATLLSQRICTTKMKAKEARKLVDKLITLGKKGTLADKRRAFAVINDHKIVKSLFDDIAPRFAARNGGYTRIISLANNRRGDNAEMAFLELTEKDRSIVSKVKASIALAKQDAPQSIEDGDVVEDAVVTEEVSAKKGSKEVDQKEDAKSAKKKTSATKKVAKKKTTKKSKEEK